MFRRRRFPWCRSSCRFRCPCRSLPPPRAMLLGLLLGLGALAASRCHCDRESSADVGLEPTLAVPRDVIFHAHVFYGGDDAYLVDGRWYCPGSRGWLVFTKEPLELEMIRHSFDESHTSSVRLGM
jgi:hypothetical protein